MDGSNFAGLRINSTIFTDNSGLTVDGGAIYFVSSNANSYVELEEVYFDNNLGAGSATNDVYNDAANFYCVIMSSSSSVVSGSVGGSCTGATTPAPTGVRLSHRPCNCKTEGHTGIGRGCPCTPARQ